MEDRRTALLNMQIAYGNDILRTHHVCGEIELSPYVRQESDKTQQVILAAIADYNDFNPRVDPDGIHDFGSVQVKGDYFYFLIQCTVTPEKRVSNRVMRILHESESSYFC